MARCRRVIKVENQAGGKIGCQTVGSCATNALAAVGKCVAFIPPIQKRHHPFELKLKHKHKQERGGRLGGTREAGNVQLKEQRDQGTKGIGRQVGNARRGEAAEAS
ncbi:hypothetical protein LTR66_015828, partial [Elasticomyces elasticus]